jgi:hypothetical protein
MRNFWKVGKKPGDDKRPVPETTMGRILDLLDYGNALKVYTFPNKYTISYWVKGERADIKVEGSNFDDLIEEIWLKYYGDSKK